MEYSNRISCIFTNKHLSVIVMKRLCSSYRLLLLAVTLVSMLSGCSKVSSSVYVVSSAKKVGIVQPGDSAFAAFRFYNNADSAVTLSILPECDCTNVSTNRLVLQPHSSEKLYVSTLPDNRGEFTKYIYINLPNGDGFHTLSISGIVE